MNETRCLCPPAYYGLWCEFFSDRISVIARVDRKTLPNTLSNITFKIRSNFLFKNVIIDYHEFIAFPTNKTIDDIKHKFYLLYSRSDQMLAHKRARYFNRTDVINNHPYSVQFDIFLLEKNGSMREIGSWHYPIYFDYLPAFRLAVVLKFPFWFGNATLNPYSQNTYNQNSTCLPIFNLNNSYYCSCKSGYFGKDCSMYEPLCETYCSVNSICRHDDNDVQMNKTTPYCICPLNHFGPRCIIKNEACNSNPCSNNATCIVQSDLSGEAAYVCICSNRFYGNQCQNKKASVHINLNMTNIFSIRATVVQLYDIPGITKLLIRHQQAYYGLPSTIHYDHNDFNVPRLGILKIYTHSTHPQYFIMYSQQQRILNISSSPQQCPHASSLLTKGKDSKQLILITLCLC